MSSTPTWHTSSYSNDSGGHCVEVAEGSTTLVRDTGNRECGHLAVEAGAWAAFLRAVKAGELDG
ncbi:hypothetical protein F4561_001565 [Lipingzhangella halophila]|uniref:DUF397 domain-containing protein n=1 Tax=Lipingzhangella halophila TaxID=1783352 RepID=A0A7W7RF06_9ACTN|nr:DUF397 domain-containing protein [Lipingzhangella halophila]MBB4930745.1 hypothetical protein [Lipingzhangella halophila]